MSKAAKGAANAIANAEAAVNVSFEDALKKLEAVVESMESDELPLEKMLERYEEGTRLVAACQARLAEAEVKIQKLEHDAAGRLGLAPLDLANDTQNEL